MAASRLETLLFLYSDVECTSACLVSVSRGVVFSDLVMRSQVRGALETLRATHCVTNDATHAGHCIVVPFPFDVEQLDYLERGRLYMRYILLKYMRIVLYDPVCYMPFDVRFDAEAWALYAT